MIEAIVATLIFVVLPLLGVVAKRRGAKKLAWALWACPVLFIAFSVYVHNMPPPRRISQRNNCIANLKQIDGAVAQWALEHKKLPADTYSLTDSTLLSYLKGSVLPVCPGGGTYLPGRKVSEPPHCSLAAEGHTF